MRRKALLLSAYDAQSHRHWHQMLSNHITDFDWTVIALPAHHFFWRVRSNGLSFALDHRECLSSGYDVLIATSMVDLATLRGLVPELASVPALVYFHENQFDYPQREAVSEHRIINVQLSSIVTAFCANRVLFNSEYNRRSFLSGARQFIKRMPDGLSSTIACDIEKKSVVLPVPIHADITTPRRDCHSKFSGRYKKDNNCVDLVWAHRWEFDKQPDVFFNALEKLYAMPEYVASSVSVRLHVMGQSFRQVPDCFQWARERGIHNVKTWGFQSRADYYQVLAKSEITVSTALHDFQGLSMIEAIHQGCIPVAPNRVAYPEYIPAELLYETGHPEQESTALAIKLCQVLCTDQHILQTSPNVSGYLDDQLISQYQAEIFAL